MTRSHVSCTESDSDSVSERCEFSKCGEVGCAAVAPYAGSSAGTGCRFGLRSRLSGQFSVTSTIAPPPICDSAAPSSLAKIPAAGSQISK